MEKGLVFGLNIGELLTIYDHDSQSWKMSECLFTGDYGKYSDPLPRSGIMLNGKIYEQATWVHHTGGKGSGSLPTPQARDTGVIRQSKVDFLNKTKGVHGSRALLSEYLESDLVQKWPTPTTRDWKDGTAKSCENVPVNGLLGRAIHFPTPQVTDSTLSNLKAGYRRKDNHSIGGLSESIMSNEKAGTTGSLNPTWVDWLMGYPIEWTDLEASEMQLSLK